MNEQGTISDRRQCGCGRPARGWTENDSWQFDAAKWVRIPAHTCTSCTTPHCELALYYVAQRVEQDAKLDSMDSDESVRLAGSSWNLDPEEN